MEQPKILIGLIPTSRVKNIEGTQSDINKVKNWLDKALSLGIGSRVSSGYGRLSNIQNLPYSSSHNFELWTQGMYGAINDKPEFRPVALRGMLRYWFRALALGIYSPAECKELEATLFGTIEPKSREGSIRIAVELEKYPPQRDLYYYKGKILLEAKTPEHLTLIEKILQLSSHLGGIGRGSRRPLHWNSPRMRGCHFQLNDFILSCDKTAWKNFMAQVRAALIAIGSSKQAPVPTKPDNPRSQDILNNQTHIYITINRDLQHPKTVTDWENKGNIPTVRGKALELLYSDNKFKGVNREGIGNPQVGGAFGTPSFVLIKSNFPTTDNYQTVIIFGANNNHRAKFVEALGADYIRVW
jgi:CRISPR-associated protein Cmr6